MFRPFLIRFHHPEHCLASSPFGFGFEIENISSLCFRKVELKLRHHGETLGTFEPLGTWHYQEARPGQCLTERYLELRIDRPTTAGFPFTLCAEMADRVRFEWTGRLQYPCVLPPSEAAAPFTVAGDILVSAPSLEGGANINIGGGDRRNDEIFERQRAQKTSEPQPSLWEEVLTARPFSAHLPGGVPLDFVPISPGWGSLGATSKTDPEAVAETYPGASAKRGSELGTEGPVEEVWFPRPFWMATTPVTIAQYRAVTGASPEELVERFDSRKSGKVDPRRLDSAAPVVYLDWEEAEDFCKKLTIREYRENRIPDQLRYRLPTENEWEYACRAGSEASRYAPFEEIAWLGNASSLRVARAKPNDWGLYDMLGFVWQWCDASRKDTETGYRILRGGSASQEAPDRQRCARASTRLPVTEGSARGSIGFRPVLAWDQA
jgi:formylglycine-generating enzyme required for sulfatase activity